jgi:hypothetical protein
VVILLPQIGADGWPTAVLRALQDSSIPVLDLSEMALEWYPNDSHPTPADQRRVADAVAGSFVTKMLDDLEVQAE